SPWPGPYSRPDPTKNVERFELKPETRLTLCPRACKVTDANGGCLAYDYDPVTERTLVDDFSSRTAVVIHDLHNLTRIQYLDGAYRLSREALVETGEITDYNYDLHGLISGVRSAVGSTSRVRDCVERDDHGRVTQSSVVPASNYPGSAITQATTFAYDSRGQVIDVVHDALGTPVRTHYHRDDKSR